MGCDVRQLFTCSAGICPARTLGTGQRLTHRFAREFDGTFLGYTSIFFFLAILSYMFFV